MKSKSKAQIVKHKEPISPPEIVFLDHNFNQYTLKEIIQKNTNTPIIVNLWSKNCKPCLQELLSLNELKKIQGDAIIIIPISIDATNMSKIKQFYNQIDLSHLKIFKDYNSQSFLSTGGIGVPMSIIINSEGMEIVRIKGYVDWLSKEINDLFSKHI